MVPVADGLAMPSNCFTKSSQVVLPFGNFSVKESWSCSFVGAWPVITPEVPSIVKLQLSAPLEPSTSAPTTAAVRSWPANGSLDVPFSPGFTAVASP